MLELFDRLLKCMGQCHTYALSEVMRWEYSIGPEYPQTSDLEGDRLYCQASLLSLASGYGVERGRFRFAVYGGIGSVGSLVALDVRDRITGCLGCRVPAFDLQMSELQFPKRNSDRIVPIAVLSFTVVR